MQAGDVENRGDELDSLARLADEVPLGALQRQLGSWQSLRSNLVLEPMDEDVVTC